MAAREAQGLRQRKTAGRSGRGQSAAANRRRRAGDEPLREALEHETIEGAAGPAAEGFTGRLERIQNADKLLLAAIFAVFVVWTYLLPPIWNHGEAREGLVVQDIVRDHEWVLADPNEGVPSKPPFFHWIAALLALVFGLSDLTVRLPSAIAAEAVAITTFVLGKSLGGRRTGWLAVGALLGM